MFVRKPALAFVLVAGLGPAVLPPPPQRPRSASSPSSDPVLPREWVDRLRSTDSKVRATAETELVLGGRSSLPLLRRLLDTEQEDLQTMTFKVIQRIGPPAIPLLVDLLRHESESVRRGAINELVDLTPHTHAVQPALQRALKD